MTTLSLSARLDRTDSRTPWGFRMQGGRDYGTQLVITRVTPGSLAAKCGLQVGDAIMKIGDSPTDGLVHKDAQQSIVNGGNSLELSLQRGGGSGLSSPATSAPAYSGSTYGAPQENAGYTPSSSAQQNYNAQPKPFSPGPGGAGGASGAGAGTGPGGSTLPVAVNKQYNTPLQMYSVDNVMDSLATQTAGLNMATPEAVPPWRSDPSSAGSPRGGGGRAPGYKAPGAVSAPSAPGRGVGGAPSAPSGVGGGGPKPAWAPTIPAGERKMKVGRSGDARRVNTQAGRVPVCSSCGVQIRGPFVSALDKTWCPDHFICANPQCQSPLIDQGFVEENNQLFCVRDYEQYFAPRCNKCTQAIIGEIVNALKQTFHMNCFLCSQCHQPIGAGSFHTEDSKIYCSKDWASMFQTKCYGCQFPVEPGDRWVEALNQNWHSECFNCSTCQVNLEGQSFFAKSGKPFCKKHASGGY